MPLWLIFFPSAGTAVEIKRDLPYVEGGGRRQSLDLYLPRGVTRPPILVFAHGGGWSAGSKERFVMLPGHRAEQFGRFWADRGVACALVNYRLSPGVRHPEHARDVARAVAWVRSHASEYGYDGDALFLGGHSAGGHLAALLGTDPRYLREVGLSPWHLRGVLPISGVYQLGDQRELLAAQTGDDPAGPAALFNHVFGPAAGDHRAASPFTHVGEYAPPFLIAYADRDLLTLPQQAEAFAAALRAKGNAVDLVPMAGRGHQTIIANLPSPGDPLGEAVVAFVARHR